MQCGTGHSLLLSSQPLSFLSAMKHFLEREHMFVMQVTIFFDSNFTRQRQRDKKILINSFESQWNCSSVSLGYFVK